LHKNIARASLPAMGHRILLIMRQGCQQSGACGFLRDKLFARLQKPGLPDQTPMRSGGFQVPHPRERLSNSHADCGKFNPAKIYWGFQKRDMKSLPFFSQRGKISIKVL